MNWNKYTLDGWLEQFGAWCDTAKHDEPTTLSENTLYRLMVSTGFVRRLYHCKIECEISDNEAMAVQNLLNDVIKRSDDEMRTDIGLLIAHKVSGVSLRKIADKQALNVSEVYRKIHGAKCYLKGRFPLYFT